MNRSLSRCFGILGAILVFAWGCIDQSQSPGRYVMRKLTSREKQAVQQILLSRTPQPRVRLNATLSIPGQGPAIILYGADVKPWPMQRGKTAELTVYYKPLRNTKGLWRTFLHLQGDRSSRGQFFNLDKAQDPAARLYHSRRWQANKFFKYTFRFECPSDLSQSQAYFMTGFWNGPTRMTATANIPSDGNNRIALGPVPVAGREMVRPVYVAYHTNIPPKIDGKLDDAVWQKAASTGKFRTYNNRRAKKRTEARIAWDKKYLYIAFDMDDDDIFSTYTKRDDPLFKQEVVEFYIDANRNRRDYIELQVSPAGKIFDSFFDSYRSPRPWGRLSYDSGMTVGVDIRGTLNQRSDRDKGWSVEMRLPFGRLGPARNLPPKDGDEWTINMYRLERSRYSGNEDHAWSPVTTGVGGDYHRISRFGTLRFSTRELFAPTPRPASRPVSRVPARTTTQPAPRNIPLYPQHKIPRLPPTARFRKLPERLMIRRFRMPGGVKIHRLKHPIRTTTPKDTSKVPSR